MWLHCVLAMLCLLCSLLCVQLERAISLWSVDVRNVSKVEMDGRLVSFVFLGVV